MPVVGRLELSDTATPPAESRASRGLIAGKRMKLNCSCFSMLSSVNFASRAGPRAARPGLVLLCVLSVSGGRGSCARAFWPPAADRAFGPPDTDREFDGSLA
jgi:hypothetical protein